MTGIGFLGAGAIIKDGVIVRGLTTAASIWITAAIGILIGVGFYFPALLSVALTLGFTAFSVFRWIESKVPVQFYAQFSVRFARDSVLPEAEMRSMIAKHGFSIANLSYRLDRVDDFFEYRMVIRTDRAANASTFAETLNRLASVKEFRLRYRPATERASAPALSLHEPETAWFFRPMSNCVNARPGRRWAPKPKRWAKYRSLWLEYGFRDDGARARSGSGGRSFVSRLPKGGRPARSRSGLRRAPRSRARGSARAGCSVTRRPKTSCTIRF